MAENQSRPAEVNRFGSRAFARKILKDRGTLCPSGRHERPIERKEATVVLGPPARVSRRRLLPFQIQLMRAGQTLPIFEPGPFDELRCFQRRVPRQRHELEFMTWLSPHDQGSEDYRAYGVVRLDEAEQLVDLRRQQAFWLRMRAERGLHTIPQARVHGPRKAADGLAREGLLRIEPALASGAYKRGGQNALTPKDVVDLMRRATPLERVAWMEEAFRSPPPADQALHRYYLAEDLTIFLVRQEGMRKVLCMLVPSEEARARGLLIYPRRRPQVWAA